MIDHKAFAAISQRQQHALQPEPSTATNAIGIILVPRIWDPIRLLSNVTYTAHIRKKSKKTFPPKTFENVQKRFSISLASEYTNLVDKNDF